MQTMALSSCEAEFMALTEVCRELMWMCRFLDEIGIEYDPPNIYCDNWVKKFLQIRSIHEAPFVMSPLPSCYC